MLRKTILAAAVTATFVFAASAAEDDFYGTYRLINSFQQLVESGQIEAFPNERGYVTYSRDGRMLLLIVRGDRPRPESLGKMTDQQRADLFRSMLAYGGTFKFDGKSIVHHIDIAWNEVWAGTAQTRDVKREGNRLTLTTRPAPRGRDGKMAVTTLVWEKVSPPSK